jgi:glycosyltransferase involved in cell wall biosynthesis
MHVLFLTPWYPNKWDVMDGIFVRKHAEAVSRMEKVTVVYAHSDATQKDFAVNVKEDGNLTEILIYYPGPSTGVMSALVKAVNFMRAVAYGVGLAESRVGKIDVCQVSVMTRCAVMAWWLKHKKGVKYYILEHWSRYYPENNSYRGFVRRLLTRCAVRESEGLMTVSHALAEAMKECGIKSSRWLRVNNVVDDFFYTDRDQRQAGGRTRLLCVTTFSEQSKNVSGIIRAIAKVRARRSDFVLDLIGNGPDIGKIRQMVDSYDLADSVTFVGEVMPPMVSKIMHRSDAVVMFSNFETFGVVLSESLAVGLPVITTNVGIAPEVVDSEIGIVVPVRDEEALVEAIDKMLDTYSLYDREYIRQRGRQFSFDTVGRQLVGLYKQAIS